MLLLTVLAGLRVSEVAGLTIGDVRDAQGVHVLRCTWLLIVSNMDMHAPSI
jgi:site-specific recombinase XerD